MIQSAHIYVTQYTRNWALKRQKIRTHTYLKQYANVKYEISMYKQRGSGQQARHNT